MKTLSQSEQEIQILSARMDELKASGDTDGFFRVATQFEYKVRQFCQMIFREIEKDNQDEMIKAAEFERLFVSRVQATLGTKGQVITGLLSAGVALAGVGISGVGIAKNNEVYKAVGKQFSQATKATDVFSRFVDNANEAERVGHQHSQKVSGSLHDAYRQVINELNQSKQRTAQSEAESERSRHQATAAPAA